MTIIKHINLGQLQLSLLKSSFFTILCCLACTSTRLNNHSATDIESYMKNSGILIEKANSWVIINKPGICGDWICGEKLHRFINSYLNDSVSKVYIVIGNRLDVKLDSILKPLNHICVVYDSNNNLYRYGLQRIETFVLHFNHGKCDLATILTSENYFEIGNRIQIGH